MATVPLTYRISSTATKPTLTTVKASPLTAIEIDGNFRSLKDAIEGLIDIGGNAATATALETPRKINNVSFNGTADITLPISTTQKSDNVSYQIPFVSSVTEGYQNIYTDSATNFTYNPSSNAVTATTFIGSLTGNVTGSVTGNAGTVTDGVYLSSIQTISGQKTFTTEIKANAGIAGNLTGNVTGNVTGNLTGNVSGNVTGNVSGNAGTVTDGVYLSTVQTISGKKTLESPVLNAATATSITLNGDQG